jgi:hypothetical protein
MDRNEIAYDPRGQGVLSCVSKMIFGPMVHSPQNVHLSCTDTNCLQMDRNEIPYDPRLLVVLSGVSKMIFEPVLCLSPTVHLSCFNISTMS